MRSSLLPPMPYNRESFHASMPALSPSQALALQAANEVARAFARRYRSLVEAADVHQEAAMAALLALPRCREGLDPAPFIRAHVRGHLAHYLRDKVRLVRVSRRAHERGGHALAHGSLDAPLGDGPLTMLDVIAAPEGDAPAIGSDELEDLLESLPASQAAAVRLTILQGLTVRQAGEALGISHTSAHRHQRAGLQALRQSLA
jgi:RNA polymerase sigma-B factor